MTAAAAQPRRRGTLMVLAGLLALSGAIRVGLGLGEARALMPDAATLSAAGLEAACTPPPAAVAAALSERAAQVETREAALADRLAALALAETAIARQLADLQAAEAALAETLARSDGAAEADLARLTAVYETMRPKDAAALFEAMEPEFAAGFLGRMRPEAAAAILGGMTAPSAYRVSLLLAARNSAVPRE